MGPVVTHLEGIKLLQLRLLISCSIFLAHPNGFPLIQIFTGACSTGAILIERSAINKPLNEDQSCGLTKPDSCHCSVSLYFSLKDDENVCTKAMGV